MQERLRSSTWETRTAAGECLAQIAAHCQHHSAADLQAAAAAAPQKGVGAQNDATAAGDSKPDAGLLSFQGFSIEAVLQRATLLLASGGKVLQELCLAEWMRLKSATPSAIQGCSNRLIGEEVRRMDC